MQLLLDTSIICANHITTKYECLDCLKELNDCDCLWADEADTVDLYCTDCNANHCNIGIEDLLAYELAQMDEETWSASNLGSTAAADDKVYEPTPPKHTYYDKCRHYNVPLEFPGGVTIYPSSKHERKHDDPAPDFGLYLDSGWKPACLAYSVAWRDYGLPAYFDTAAYAIIDAFNKAKMGMWVEVGCIGGHGRTGTALACMGVLAGMKPAKAIKYVRQNYCDHAIETKDQEWWVSWFDAFVNGGVAPGRETEVSHYDSEQKKTVYEKEIVPPETFDVPIAWQHFSVYDDPQGKPPAEISGTLREKYVTVSWYDEKNKYQSFHVEPGHPQFDEYVRLAKEEAKSKSSAKSVSVLGSLIGLDFA